MENKKLKAFISVPMKNRTQQEIMEDIATMEEAAHKVNPVVEFVSTIVKETPPYNSNKQSIWYLGKSLEILSQCDIVVCKKELDPIYSGCIIEKEVAKRYCLQVIELMDTDEIYEDDFNSEGI